MGMFTCHVNAAQKEKSQVKYLKMETKAFVPSQEASFIGEWSIVNSSVGWKMLGPFP